MKYRAGLQMVNSHRSPRSWILSCEKHQHVGSQPGRELPLLSSLTGNPSLAPGSAGDLQCNIYPPSRGTARLTCRPSEPGRSTPRQAFMPTQVSGCRASNIDDNPRGIPTSSRANGEVLDFEDPSV